jgi:hypothetical protein
MSAWIVGRAHIDVLVQALAEGEHVTDVDPDELGRRLWRENLVSVATRYPNDGDGERPGPIGFRDSDVDTYVYRRPTERIDPTGVLYAVSCYQYQCAEYDGWDRVEAQAWVNRLREALTAHPDVDPHPDFGTYPWGFEEEDVHGEARAAS